MKEYYDEPGLFSKIDKSGLWVLPIILGVGMILFYIFVLVLIYLVGPSGDSEQTDQAITISSVLLDLLCNGIYFSIAILSIYTGLKWKKRSAT